MTASIRLHHIMECSTVNGPDNRFVIWTQGCPFHCDGCFNQTTHSQTGGFDMDIAQLANKINQTKEMPDNAAIRGMIEVVKHLVKVEE